MKKRFLALCTAVAMMLSLAACSGAGAGTNASGDNANDSAGSQSGDKKYTVGICQLVTHDALDAATKGFMDELEKLLPGQVEFDLQNAANDSATCSTIANGFVAANVDLILGNATPALVAAATATSDIPVLGTSITEYGTALKIDNFNGTVGGNVSGTSDLAPLDQQAAMIKEWCPDAKNVALLYCSAEPNSQYQVDTVQGYLEDMGFTCTQYPFSDSNDVAAVTNTAVAACDVMYIPTDNTAASNTDIIDNICQPAGIPVFAGEEGICKGCGVATLSISYYDLGVGTARMAAKILTGESNISEMPIEYAPEFTKKYNPEICSALGLTVPEGYEAIE